MRFGHSDSRWHGGGFFEPQGREHRRGWGHHERGGGRRRVFDGGELRLVLLALLEAQPRHGYDVIREIEERTGGSYVPSPGVVYPTLTMLDELGYIDEVKEEGARKRFAITDAGRAHLSEKREDVDKLLERLSRMGQEEGRTGAAPIKRAMMGLSMALRDTLGSSRGREDLVHDVAAILDEAARKIERLEK